MEEERDEEMMGSLSLSGVGTSGASGDGPDNQGGNKDNAVVGVSPGEYEAGQSDGGWADRADGEGGNGGWTWGVVQQESGGRPGELEWCQL